MRTCLPTRFLASTASNHALAPLCFESATHSFTITIQPPRQICSSSATPARPGLTGHPCVHGWPSQFPAGGIQSPYVHRASGLAQIAVSTMLRASSIGNRRFLHAEHCRYGTRDLSPIVILSEKRFKGGQIFSRASSSGRPSRFIRITFLVEWSGSAYEPVRCDAGLFQSRFCSHLGLASGSAEKTLSEG